VSFLLDFSSSAFDDDGEEAAGLSFEVVAAIFASSLSLSFFRSSSLVPTLVKLPSNNSLTTTRFFVPGCSGSLQTTSSVGFRIMAILR